MAKMTDTSAAVENGATGTMVPRPFVIDKVRKNTADTFTLTLHPADGGSFEFAPGQFNMLYVYGVGEIPMSISGDPFRTSVLVHTTRVVGDVTRGLRRLQAGETVGVRGPFGSSWPVKEAEGNDVIIVAGGIGLAPLRPVIYHILENRRKYGKVILHYGTRTPSDILYLKQLEQWRSRFDFEVDVTVDRDVEGWNGDVGVVTTLIPKAPFDPLNTIALTCGPEVMMRFTVMALQRRGVPMNNIYVSMERNMKCGAGLCGHCQMGPKFVCKDGPIFTYESLKDLFNKREI